MGLTRGACLHCQLPSLPRALLIAKGRQSLFHLAISRNGRVLFLSEQPLAELVDKPVYVLFRPWPDRKNGTIVQIRRRACLAGGQQTPSSHYPSLRGALSSFTYIARETISRTLGSGAAALFERDRPPLLGMGAAGIEPATSRV